MPDIVTFDVTGPGLYIIPIDPGSGDIELDIDEIYSEWKVWAAMSDNLKYPPAFRVVGGDPITDVQNLGSTFFINTGDGWYIRPNERDHQLTLVGNLFTDPANVNPIAPTLGNYTVLVKQFVSSLVDASVARLDLAQLLDAVYVDTIDGDDTNDGTNTGPVQTLSKAFDVAGEKSLSTFRFRGNITLDRNATNWLFVGQSELSSSIDVSGFDVSGSRFEKCALQGTLVGRIEAAEARLDALTDLDGVFRECGLTGSVSTVSGAVLVFTNCFSEVAATGTPVLTLGSNNELNVRNWSGGIELRSVTAGTDVSVDLNPGKLVLDASCTGGSVIVRGGTELDDSSAGTTVTRDGLLQSKRANQAALAAQLAASK